jgi:hypothetical protein
MRNGLRGVTLRFAQEVRGAIPEMDQPRPRRFRTIQDRPKDLRVASC